MSGGKLCFLETTEDKHVKELIQDHYFNSQIEITMPNITENSKNDLKEFEDLFFQKNFHAVHASLLDLLNPKLLLFIKKGDLILLSIGTKIDFDDCFAVQNGHIILNISRDSYQTLGLDGKSSKYLPEKKYIISIDTKKESFNEGHKEFERVKNCFLSKLTHTILFLLTINNEDAEKEILDCFGKRETRAIEKRDQIIESTIPDLNQILSKFSLSAPQSRLPEVYEMYQDIFEWLGLISCGIKSSSQDETASIKKFISSYEEPTPNSNGTVFNLKWRGFLSPHRIEKLFKLCCKFVQEGKTKWVSICCLGFKDAPVGWKENEHNFLVHGESHYSVIIDKKKMLLMKSVGPFDSFP